MKFTSRSFAAGLLLVAAGCSGAATRVTEVTPVAFGDPSGIVTTVTLSAGTFTAGQGTLTVHVRSVNPTSLPIRLPFTDGCFQTFVVFAGSQEIGGPELACLQFVSTRTLGPGEALEQAIPWDGHVFYERGDYALPPGDYRLVGQVNTTGPPRSDPVALQIVAP